MGKASESEWYKAAYSFLAPIPEPSTYAAVLGLAVLAVAWVRRRK
jgi:hypothetical protein